MMPEREELLEVIEENEKKSNAPLFFRLRNKVYLMGDCQWKEFCKSLPEQSTLRWEALLSALIAWQGREKKL
jgi:hypothetical protein